MLIKVELNRSLFYWVYFVFSFIVVVFEFADSDNSDVDEVSVCNLAEMQQSVPSTDDGKFKIVKFMEIFFNTSRNLLVFQIHILMMPLIGESLDCNIIFLLAV